MKKTNNILWIFFLSIYLVIFILYSISIFTNLDQKDVKKTLSDTERFPFNNMIIKQNEKNNKKFKIKINNNIVDLYYKVNDNNIVHFADKQIYNSSNAASKILKLSGWLSNKNIDFLYVENPKKEYFYQDIMKKYNYDYNTENEEIINLNLDNNDIKHINGNDILKKSNINRNEMFYNTDYHWTNKTALYFGKQLLNYMNVNYNYKFDTSLLEYDKFHEIKFEKSYYGYYGRNIGLTKTEYDDFSIYEPNYDTDFDVYYGKEISNVSGKFLDTLYDMKYIYNPAKKGIKYKYQPYLYQLGGIQPIVKIKNNHVDNDNKVLFIVDSMFYALGPYLSLSIGNMDIIDIRNGNGNFKKDLQNYINNTKPDCVVYISEISYDNDLERLNF